MDLIELPIMSFDDYLDYKVKIALCHLRTTTALICFREAALRRPIPDWIQQAISCSICIAVLHNSIFGDCLWRELKATIFRQEPHWLWPQDRRTHWNHSSERRADDCLGMRHVAGRYQILSWSWCPSSFSTLIFKIWSWNLLVSVASLPIPKGSHSRGIWLPSAKDPKSNF